MSRSLGSAESGKRSSVTTYDELVVRVAASEIDLAIAEFHNLETLGVLELEVSGDRVLHAFFLAGQMQASNCREVVDRLPSAELVSWGRLAEGDWLAKYRKAARPFAVGTSLWVDPREPEASPEPAPAGRRLLHLPARTAFGTGSHESTQLALELLEETDLAGLRVLDVGSGTGILAFAALLGGAGTVVGLEIDPVAALVGAQNQRLNDAVFPVVAGGVESLASMVRFDLVLVNVLPGKVLSDWSAITHRSKTGAAAIVSGFLRDYGPKYESMLRPLGWRRTGQRTRGDWCAWMLEKVQ